MKLCKSEVAQRLDDESFRITKNTEKTLVFEVYMGCIGVVCVCTWDNSIIWNAHEVKFLET
jgi:hypothetical protein